MEPIAQFLKFLHNRFFFKFWDFCQNGVHFFGICLAFYRATLAVPIWRKVSDVNEIGWVAFQLALGPHNDHNIQTDNFSAILGSGDLKTDISIENWSSKF